MVLSVEPSDALSKINEVNFLFSKAINIQVVFAHLQSLNRYFLWCCFNDLK